MTGKKSKVSRHDIPNCSATKNLIDVIIIVPRTDGQKEYKRYSFCREQWDNKRDECSATYLSRNGGQCDAG